MKTIAQQLKIKDFPFEIEDKNGNQIYLEYSDGYWSKSEYDLEREIDFIKHEVDFVPDDLDDYKNKLSSSDFKKIEKAFAYRKKHFDDMSDSKRKFYE